MRHGQGSKDMDHFDSIGSSVFRHCTCSGSVVKSLQDRRQRCTDDLNHTKGQLHLIAGHVGSERLAQQEEVVKLTRAELLERELTEHAARRLLIEIEKVEAERATHLGPRAGRTSHRTVPGADRRTIRSDLAGS